MSDDLTDEMDEMDAAVPAPPRKGKRKRGKRGPYRKYGKPALDNRPVGKVKLAAGRRVSKEEIKRSADVMELLEQAMLASGFNARELSVAAGYSEPLVTMILRGQTSASVVSLQRIARAMGRDVVIAFPRRRL